MNAKTKSVLETLFVNYGLFLIFDDMPSFYQSGYFTAQDIQDLNDVYVSSLNEIRTYCLGLVDAFRHDDDELLSVIGGYDGNVYEKMVAAFRANPINKRHTLKGFNEYMRPFLMKNPEAKL